MPNISSLTGLRIISATFLVLHAVMVDLNWEIWLYKGVKETGASCDSPERCCLEVLPCVRL